MDAALLATQTFAAVSETAKTAQEEVITCLVHEGATEKPPPRRTSSARAAPSTATAQAAVSEPKAAPHLQRPSQGTFGSPTAYGADEAETSKAV